jgi:glycosyltransferase involved in cell wall biosynthesis
MHALFVHQNYPAQFGHIAERLRQREGWQISFVTQRQLPPGTAAFEIIHYSPTGGARPQTHFLSRTFENAVAHAEGVYVALKNRRLEPPDVIIGHSGFGSTLFLSQLFSAPIINYCEYFYHPSGNDLGFRPDFPTTEEVRLRAAARNAMLLLDLENCRAAYSPTRWQASLLPARYADKLQVIFDGVDTTVWKPSERRPEILAGVKLPEHARLVTYASRGFESMRGFDIFMQVAGRIAAERADVQFIIVGEDRCCYGDDQRVTGDPSFKNWVLQRGNYPAERFHFVGRLPPAELARVMSAADLHFYLTVPFVLSWSLIDAMACGATLLASSTAPVRELLQHGRNALLADFFDVEHFTEQALRVLERPSAFRDLGREALADVQAKYSLDVCLPQLERFYRDVAHRGC